jgi:NAD(P)-dependent dehydrogenase (short-subunit alcohol dehydrogenase family)
VLDDKVIVVTGGAGLLGAALARGLVERGGTVVVADIDLNRASSLASAIEESNPGMVMAVQLDITDRTSVCALIDKVSGKYGRVHCLVNNAYPRNRAYGRKVEAVTYADFCENVDGHLGGYFLVTQQFAQLFRDLGGGSIVSMASIYGVIAPRFEVYDGTPMTMPVEYAAIKSGIIHLTRYFAKYYVRDGVRVNCVSPGGIFDGQPLSFLDSYRGRAGVKGMLDPADVVGAVAFMLSDDSRFITGQNLIVDDGFSL